MRERVEKILFLMCIVASLGAMAGDDATFKSLGWSLDSSHYAFAQYGYLDGSGFPYASAYVIDARSNRYVKDGSAEVILKNLDRKDTGALVQLLGKMRDKLQAAGIFERKGGDSPIVPSCSISEGGGSSTCMFTSRWHGSLKLTMKQQSVVGDDPTSDATKSAFSLRLEGNGITPLLLEDGKTWRVRVLDYKITKVFFSPDGQHIAVIVQKREAAFEGPSTRYMAEVGRIQKVQ